MTGTQKETLPSTKGPSAGTGASAGTPAADGHAGGLLEKVKAAMGGAPWQASLLRLTFHRTSALACLLQPRIDIFGVHDAAFISALGREYIIQRSLTCVSVLQDHHDKTLQALTHAKKAHLHAMQAQASLRSAQEAQQKAETAQRKKQEVSIFCPPHRQIYSYKHFGSHSGLNGKHTGSSALSVM